MVKQGILILMDTKNCTGPSKITLLSTVEKVTKVKLIPFIQRNIYTIHDLKLSPSSESLSNFKHLVVSFTRC